MAEKPLENACWRTIIRIAPSVTVNSRYEMEMTANGSNAFGFFLSVAFSAAAGAATAAAVHPIEKSLLRVGAA